ncbi:glycosyltransferase, group 1 family protein [Varibaculum cambriense]|uniref:Glycosyltransferase, group 1 family protein n=2 Tax=Varibaculum cambriense TaxID=184870 RepID=A0AB34WXA4_9ACTO|nr:glycosyltransferase, group 1 family protein [Varibaculum cambriense]
MDRGGAETLIMNLFRTIDRTKIQFDFLVHCQERGDYDEEIEALGGRIFRVEVPSAIKLPPYYLQCKNFFASHPEISVVHGHMGSTAAFYLRAAKKTGKYTIAHSHAQKYPLSLSELTFRIASYPTRFTADYFMGASYKALLDRYGSKVAKGKNSIVLHNGIDSKAFGFSSSARERIRADLGISTDIRVYIDVARLIIQKNHEFLLDVFAELIEQNPDSLLLLLGSGDREAELRQKTQELDITSKVMFLGVRGDVADVLSASDFFILTSFSEGCPVSVIEAQANGLPCFLSSGVPPLVDCGKEVYFMDISQGTKIWVDALTKAAGTVPDLSERLSGVERVKLHDFDISKTAYWLQDFYLRAAS